MTPSDRSEVQAMIQEAVAALREEIARAARLVVVKPYAEPDARNEFMDFAERVRKGAARGR